MLPPCIVDTTVVAAGLLSGEADSPSGRLLDAMLAGRTRFLVSPDLFSEYREVLLRPSTVACHGLTEAEVDEILRLLAFKATPCDPPTDECLIDDVVADYGDLHLGELLGVDDEALVITVDQRLAADLEDLCNLAAPADLPAQAGLPATPASYIGSGASGRSVCSKSPPTQSSACPESLATA